MSFAYSKNDQVEPIRLLTDYFSDIDTQLIAIFTAKSAHDCLFSPQHMTSTMCQFYFLYIGRMCRSKIGIDILTNTHIFNQYVLILFISSIFIHLFMNFTFAFTV